MNEISNISAPAAELGPAPWSQRSDHAARPGTVFVCRTCPRPDAPGRVAQGNLSNGDGLALGAALKSILQGGEEVSVRMVECLSGCRTPCNIRLSGPGKFWWRFHGLSPVDADSVAAFARLYVTSSDGMVVDQDFPDGLKHKLAVAVVPPFTTLSKAATGDAASTDDKDITSPKPIPKEP